jgi:hypothetical protein
MATILITVCWLAGFDIVTASDGVPVVVQTTKCAELAFPADDVTCDYSNLFVCTDEVEEE